MDDQSRDRLLTRAFSAHASACHQLTVSHAARNCRDLFDPLCDPRLADHVLLGHDKHSSAAIDHAAWMMLETGGGPDWVLRAWRIVRDRLLRAAARIVGAREQHVLANLEDDADGVSLAEHDDDRSPTPALVLADTVARHAPPTRALTPSTREEPAA